MSLSKSKLNNCLKEFQTDAESITNVDFENTEKINIIISKYNEMSAFISDLKGIPEEVRKFVISGEKPDRFPEEYSALLSIETLRENIKASAAGQIQKAVLDKNFGKAVDIFGKAIRFDIKNIELVEYLEDIFKNQDLTEELIDLYKVEFIYTLNPLCFEKTGDIYYGKGDCESATDAYLSCAEINGDYLPVYEKLAVIFEKNGDDTSRQACLQQIQRIKDGL